MKKIFLLFIAIPFLTIAQKAETKFVLDYLGNKSDHQTLWLKYPEKAFEFRIVKDSGMIHQMSLPKYEVFQSDYKIIKKEIEKITLKTYSDTTNFLIYFNYFNDNCGTLSSNTIDKNIYNSRKSYLKFKKKKLERDYKNLVIIMLFQNGISIYKNEKINPEKEYFFNDKNNFFRKNIFKKSAVCGSSAIINSDGKILTGNGEDANLQMINYLKPEIWNKIFSTTNVNEKTEDKE